MVEDFVSSAVNGRQMREYHSVCCDDDAYISHFGISKNKKKSFRDENLSKTSS